MIGAAFLPRSERAARAAWTRVAEPCDQLAAGIVAEFGAVEGLRLVAASADRRCARFLSRLATLDVDADLARAEQVGARLLIPSDDEWPKGVDDLATPPYALWVRGPLDVGSACTNSVAVVGARAATAYGEAVAADISAGVAARGRAIVSGAAFGIDGAAHRGALAVDGTTLAVLACGVDRVYPAAHGALLQEIARVGAVVSELPPGAAPMRQRFLLRNRLIATMTQGTVVVEAGLRSGSRNTAATAAEHGRVVAAVPGPVSSMSSAGCHEMVRAGMAILVTDAEEVLDAVGRLGEDGVAPRRGPARPHDGLDEADARLVEALPLRAGAPIQDIARVAGLADREVQARLGRLELVGLAARDAWGWRRGSVG